jgi:8-oxo-dGTP pyrophosphatase MutT (NUDIX family)
MAEVIADNERHRIVTTCIIYNSEGHFLVIKRSPTRKVYPNKWTVPGGGFEPNDYINTPKTTEDAWYFVIEKTLRREVREETNLEVETPQYLLDCVFIRPDNVPVLILSYYAKYKSGDVKLEEGDATEFKWITVNEGRGLGLIPGILEEIEMVGKILKLKDVLKNYKGDAQCHVCGVHLDREKEEGMKYTCGACGSMFGR